MGVVYRACEESDIGALSAFHLEVCGSESPPDFWHWKYFRNPAGRARICLAVDGERIIGRVGELPVELKAGNLEVRAAQCVDIDIHPSYRGSHYPRMGRLASQMSAETGTVCDFAFPNPLAAGVAIKVSRFSGVANVRKWVKPVDVGAYLGRVPIPGLRRLASGIHRAWMQHSLRDPGEILVVPVARFDAGIDDLWSRAGKSQVMVVRRSAYLNWKYADCPLGDHRLFIARRENRCVGYIVLRIIERAGRRYGYIADLLAAQDEPEAVSALLRHAVRFAMTEQAVAVIAWCPPAAPLARDLKRWGFLSTTIRSQLIVRTYRPDQVPLDVLQSESNWFYTFGDSDYLLVPRPVEA